MSRPPVIGFDFPIPPPGVALRREHWSTDGLKALLLPNSGSPSVRVYDPVRDLWTPVASTGHGSQNPTQHGLIQFTDIAGNEAVDVAADQSTIINTRQATIILARQKLDVSTVGRVGFCSVSLGSGDVCALSLPSGDGNVNWTFGDFTSGVRMLTVPTPVMTLNPEVWICTAGPHGMAVYRDGVLVASHSTPASGPTYTGPFQLGAGGSNSDLTIVSFFAVLDAEWNAQQVQEWTGRQDLMFVRKNVALFGPSVPAPPPNDEFTIDGAPIDILQNWSISEQLNERGTMRFGVKSMDASYRPALRDVVDFHWAGIHFFAGHIHHTDEGGLGGYGVVPIVTDCGATDFNALPDRRQLAITLPAGTLKSMLEIIEPYLASYGVTLDPAQVDGPTLDELVFQIGSLKSVLDKLSLVSEYAWEIDYDKVLRMFQPGIVAAPFNIEDNDARVIGDVRVSPTTVDYGNRIVVLAGTGTHDVADTFTGDGVEDTFELNYTVSTLYGYVTNDVTNETLRIVGDPDAATWEYNPTTNSITRLTGAPANGNAISIPFVAQFPFEVVAENVPAQDGGANLFELTKPHPEVFDVVTAQALADGYLVRSLVQPREIRYRTRLHGLHPGMQQQIQVTGRNVDGPCLITAVEISPEGSAKYNYDVTAVEGLVIVASHQEKWRQMGGVAA